MSELSFEMITSTNSLKMLMNKHDLKYEDILMLNPRLRNEGHLGELIYFYKKSKILINKSEILSNLKQLVILYRLYIISFINKYNDTSLLENELTNYIVLFSTKYINNNQQHFNKVVLNIHENIKSFIKDILSNLNNLNHIKSSLKDNINILNIILLENDFILEKDKLKTSFEFILLSIVKIIENNHYDSFNIMFDILNEKN
jgi:hypothetical protein